MLGRAALKRTILAGGLARPSRNSSILPSTSTGTNEHMSKTLQRLLDDELSDSSVEIIEKPNPRMVTSKHSAQRQPVEVAGRNKEVLKDSLEMNSSSGTARSSSVTKGRGRVKPGICKRSFTSPDKFFEDEDEDDPAQSSVTKRRSPKQPVRTHARSFKSPSSASRTVSMGSLSSGALISSVVSSSSAMVYSTLAPDLQPSAPMLPIERKASTSAPSLGRKRKVDEAVDTASSGALKKPSKAKMTTTPSTDKDLPVYSFKDYKDPEAAVVYIRDEEEANRLVQTLEGPLGFDMEWRVFWRPYSHGRTALVQLCDKRTILLIQVSAMPRFPQKVLEVIENPTVVKTGANIMNDGDKLFRDFGVRACNLVELGMFAKEADDEFVKTYARRVVALAKMVAMYLGKTLAKGEERLSNWEFRLDSKKIEYAANDVHSSCLVYHRLLSIAAEANKEIDMSTVRLDVGSSTGPRLLSTSAASISTAGSVDITSIGPTAAASENQTTAASNNETITASKSRTAVASKSQITPMIKSRIAATASSSDTHPPGKPRPQWLRAYNLWHHRQVPLGEMCSSLKYGDRALPLKPGTVISYIVQALQADASLPYDGGRLTELVKMDADSWKRHGPWVSAQVQDTREKAV